MGGALHLARRRPHLHDAELAGLGIHRKSDIGLPLDISMRSYNSTTPDGQKYDDSETRVKFDNFGFPSGRTSRQRDHALLPMGRGLQPHRVFRPHDVGYNNPTETRSPTISPAATTACRRAT